MSPNSSTPAASKEILQFVQYDRKSTTIYMSLLCVCNRSDHILWEINAEILWISPISHVGEQLWNNWFFFFLIFCVMFQNSNSRSWEASCISCLLFASVQTVNSYYLLFANCSPVCLSEYLKLLDWTLYYIRFGRRFYPKRLATEEYDQSQ